MKKKVSCIIPAYNEEKGIGNVLSIISGHPLVNEIIVINDGSTDKTEMIVRKFKNVKLINLHTNHGKIFAVLEGIKSSRGDLIMLIDGDLDGLRKENITNLCLPVIENISDISISLRNNVPRFYKIIGLDFISGERVFPKNLLQNFEELLSLPGWGLEVFINKMIINKNLRVKIVSWKNVRSPYPGEKCGFLRGNIRLVRMISQIIKIIGINGCIDQIIKMKKLEVK